MSFRILLSVGLYVSLCTANAVAQKPDLRPPDNGDFIRDTANLLDAESTARISKICGKLVADNAPPIIVVTIDSMAQNGGDDNTSIETFAATLFDQWQIGHQLQEEHRGKGILLLVSKDDRRCRIELGTGWARKKDPTCHQIMNEYIIPQFKQSRFSKGITSGVAALGSMARGLKVPSAERPNIVVILVDDMGFSDIGCYGSEIPTPNLDALAAGGLRFTQFYNTGRCCPTRASLLTGLYSHQAGVGHMTSDYGVTGYQGRLNDRCVTIGNIASSAGYLSVLSGKWHVGHQHKSNWPVARGFDRFYGIPEGGGFYFQLKKGRSIVLNEDVIHTIDKPLPDGWYSTDAFVEHGLNFVDEAKAANKPFLWYLAHNAPHFPLQASAEDIAKFRGKYIAGWDHLSEARYKRQIEMGLIDSNWMQAKRAKKIKAWDTLTDERKDELDHLMASYAACVYAMDRSIGAMVKGLKSRGEFDNTLILFMSDNGGCAEGGIQGKMIGDPTKPKSNWMCGESWAWLQDTPFRKYKHYNHEGGIATPLIAHWPNGISDQGAWRTQPAHVIDIMATIKDLTAADYPAQHQGQAIHPLEGVSLRPAFNNQPLQREALYWEHEGNAAIRVGNWKLVRQGAKSSWELYNLKTDRTEQNNLAGQHRDRTIDMKQQWLKWAARCNVSPNGIPKTRKK